MPVAKFPSLPPTEVPPVIAVAVRFQPPTEPPVLSCEFAAVAAADAVVLLSAVDCAALAAAAALLAVP